MNVPAWNDPALKASGMVRAALWLAQEVGEGNSFTKERLRADFPGVAQIDRRVRELRKYGWVILASTEDATLTAEEQRLTKIGAAVWDPEKRRAAAPRHSLSSRQIRAVLEHDDFLCTTCGISGGEEYPDDPNCTGVLSVTRRPTVMPDGEEKVLPVTECRRCRAGSSDAPARADEVAAAIRSLDPADQKRLIRWIQRKRRVSTPLDRVWSAYRRLSAEAQDEISSELERHLR